MKLWHSLLICTLSGVAIATFVTKAKVDPRPSKLKSDSTFEYWLTRPESEVRAENVRRLKAVYQVVKQYMPDAEDPSLPDWRGFGTHSLEPQVLSGTRKSEIWRSALCPPEEQYDPGFLWFAPDRGDQNEFDNSKTRMQMFEEDKAHYPILMSVLDAPFLQEVGEFRRVEVLYLNGEVKTVTLRSKVPMSGEYRRQELGKL